MKTNRMQKRRASGSHIDFDPSSAVWSGQQLSFALAIEGDKSDVSSADANVREPTRGDAAGTASKASPKKRAKINLANIASDMRVGGEHGAGWNQLWTTLLDFEVAQPEAQAEQETEPAPPAALPKSREAKEQLTLF